MCLLTNSRVIASSIVLRKDLPVLCFVLRKDLKYSRTVARGVATIPVELEWMAARRAPGTDLKSNHVAVWKGKDIYVLRIRYFSAYWLMAGVEQPAAVCVAVSVLDIDAA